jgi:PAS domain S-box-containing protein
MAKILIVESDSGADWNVEESLQRSGHTVVANVSSSDAAVQAANDDQPDLVLIDIRLQSAQDSQSAVGQIRQQLNIPVLYWTPHPASLPRQPSDLAGAPQATQSVAPPHELHSAIEIALLRHQFDQFEQRFTQIERLILPGTKPNGSDRPAHHPAHHPAHNPANHGIAIDRFQSIQSQSAQILTQINEAIVLFDQYQTIVLFNAAAERLFGYSAADILGRSLSLLLPTAFAEFCRQLAPGVFQGELLSRRADGKEFLADLSVSPLGLEPEPLFTGVFRDITARKQAEEQLRQQAEREKRVVQGFNAQLEQQVRDRTLKLRQALDFEALLKRITDRVRDSLDESQILQTAVQELAQELEACSCDTGIYDLVKRTTTITHECLRSAVMSPALDRRMSLSQQPDIYDALLDGRVLQFCWLTGQSNLDLRDIQAPLTVLACPLRDQQEVMGDLWLYLPADRHLDAAEIRLVEQVANQCAIAIRQARLYKAAQAQVSDLERLNHLKDDFLNTISHELRTPVASIRMASQMLEIRLQQAGLLEASPDNVGRYLQILQDECDREINLINNILDLSRLDAQIEPITPFAITLQSWIPHLLEPFLTRIQQQEQRLTVDIPEDLPPFQSDLSSLGKILTELINNACKYTAAGEEIRIAVRAEDLHLLRIEVSNSGVEIPLEERSQLFDKFYRSPSWDPWRQGGTGLGLALVKRLVNHIGGEITVQSAEHWTTFAVELEC